MQMYKSLFEKKLTSIELQTLSVTKQLGIWLSSIHYNQKGPEKKIKQDIWQRNLGNYLLRYYQKAAIFGENVVLNKRNPYTE